MLLIWCHAQYLYDISKRLARKIDKMWENFADLFIICKHWADMKPNKIITEWRVTKCILYKYFFVFFIELDVNVPLQ